MHGRAGTVAWMNQIAGHRAVVIVLAVDVPDVVGAGGNPCRLPGLHFLLTRPCLRQDDALDIRITCATV
jgi:hypothetical protein